ncbi:MAG: triphosphoribosyl-dephospho-CoA synthase [Collinsella phocaeensis]
MTSSHPGDEPIGPEPQFHATPDRASRPRHSPDYASAEGSPVPHGAPYAAERAARSGAVHSLPPCERLARWAAASLVAEARLTPKPGLVDRRNTGAHRDMDLDTFLASATALEPCFHVYASAGTRWDGRIPADLAHALRELGIEAERAMFSATHGINTHKGANFAFALILGSCGAFLSENGSLPSGPRDTERVLELVRSMGACLLDTDIRILLARSQRDGRPNDPSSPIGNGAHGGPAQEGALSHGERIYLRNGLSGARGEAAQGYPLLKHELLPYLRRECPAPCSRGGSERDVADTLLRALVKLMARLEDTNVVHRGGIDALAAHRSFCAELDERSLPNEELRAALERYDDELVALNVSPGGAADLLSLGIFFSLMEGLFGLDALRYRS